MARGFVQIRTPPLLSRLLAYPGGHADLRPRSALIASQLHGVVQSAAGRQQCSGALRDVGETPIEGFVQGSFERVIAQHHASIIVDAVACRQELLTMFHNGEHHIECNACRRAFPWRNIDGQVES